MDPSATENNKLTALIWKKGIYIENWEECVFDSDRELLLFIKNLYSQNSTVDQVNNNC